MRSNTLSRQNKYVSQSQNCLAQAVKERRNQQQEVVSAFEAAQVSNFYFPDDRSRNSLSQESSGSKIVRFTRIPTVFIKKRIVARRVDPVTVSEKSSGINVLQNAYIQHQVNCLGQVESFESAISTQPLQTRDNFYPAKDKLPVIKEPSQKRWQRNKIREVSKSLNAKSELFCHQNQVINSYGIQNESRFINDVS